jgi:hypothetical protein
MTTLWSAEVAQGQSAKSRSKGRKKLFKGLFTEPEDPASMAYSVPPQHRYDGPADRPAGVQGQFGSYDAPMAAAMPHQAPIAPSVAPLKPQQASDPDMQATTMPGQPRQTSRESLDHIAQLIVEKAQLESDIKSRETQYETLLKESQSLTKQMRVERDAALLELEKKQAAACSSPTRDCRCARHSNKRHRHCSCRARIDYKDCDERVHSHSKECSHQSTRDRQIHSALEPGLSRGRSKSRAHHQAVFVPQAQANQPHLAHEDRHFQEGFSQLELLIKQFVLQHLKAQPDALPGPPVALDPAVALYVDRHGLRHATVFGVRDIRCIVLRGYLMHAILENVFRCFLFGLSPNIQQSLLDAYKDMMRAYPGDPSRASRWAAGAATGFVSSAGSQGGAYDPVGATHQFAETLFNQLKDLVAQVYDDPIYPHEGIERRDDTDFSHRVGREKVLGSLQGIIRCAMGMARDCRLDSASFVIELPVHLAQFDEHRMWASEGQHGPVAVAYAPIVLKKVAVSPYDAQAQAHDSREQYEDPRGYLLCRARVWRTSILSDVQDLSKDYNRDYNYR